jgi:sulfur carrier protein ThiS
MHRGSSKGGAEPLRPPEHLPLSASPRTVRVVFEVTRGAGVREHPLTVPEGTLVRVALRAIGQAPEGSAVLDGATPVPLDTPLDRPIRLTVVPTFSGG